MKAFAPHEIRNIALIGHKASGKTSIAESALWAAKATSRLGSTAHGTSVLDFEAEEQKRVMSTGTSVATFEWKKHGFNLLDTPGDANFLRDTRTTLLAADIAVCAVSAKDGVEPMTDRLFGWAEEAGLASALVLTKLDLDAADFERSLQDIRDHLTEKVCPVQIPIREGSSFIGVADLLTQRALLFGKADDGTVTIADIPESHREAATDARNQLIEDIASNDEELMEKFFEEALTDEEIRAGLVASMREGYIVPLYCACGTSNQGVSALLDGLVDLFPSPVEARWRSGRRGAEIAELAPSEDGPLVCQVFKTIVDQHAGKISLLRVLSGTAKSDTTLENPGREGAPKERLGALQAVLGKKLSPIDEAPLGAIFAVAKLKDVHTGDTLSEDGFVADVPQLAPPLISRAVHAQDKAQEDKILAGLQRIIEEDPGLTIDRDPSNGELILLGTGQQHIEVAVERMQRKFGVACTLSLPRVPYRETFTRPVSDIEGKHKKQSGGHGQFAVIQVDFAPGQRGSGLEFEDAVVGGSVPRQFIPSVEKGVRKAMARGVLAGYPVVDVHVRLKDGKHHPVDSSDMAFQVAASKAFKLAAEQARPRILEPLMDVEIRVPEEAMGDVMADVSGRRGRVVGSEPSKKSVVVKAQIPLAELQTYEASLRAMTQGRGSFVMQPSHLEPVPPPIQDKIIQESGFVHADEED